MAPESAENAKQQVDAVFRTESRRILATLIRLLGDFDLAEEAMQEAFASAVQSWPMEGVPDNPRAWLIAAGRFKAIDAIRRRARFNSALQGLAEGLEESGKSPFDEEEVADDVLRLIFTCCHPALPIEGQIALTLREVCDLTTEEIARAFLTSPPTVAQRIVRAKAKIRDAKIPYRVPSAQDLPDRIEAVLRVIYLVYNEGYSASSGESVVRSDLSGEAIRLARLVRELIKDSEVEGLLALLVLNESRRKARVTAAGDLVLLENQDRSLWNLDLIAEGQALVREALSAGPAGPYTLQAAISAVHSQAVRPQVTDWGQIVSLYDLLLRIEASPVVELNRAVAVAMRDGPEVGLALIEAIMDRGNLLDYHLAYSARAEFSRRAGKMEDARRFYEKALELAKQEPERRFLRSRLAGV